MTKEEFKEIRLKLGWTQKEAAQKLGKDKRMITYYEAGRNIPESTAKLMRFFVSFGGLPLDV